MSKILVLDLIVCFIIFFLNFRIDDDYNLSKIHSKGDRNLNKLEGRRNGANTIKANNSYLKKINHISSFGKEKFLIFFLLNFIY